MRSQKVASPGQLQWVILMDKKKHKVGPVHNTKAHSTMEVQLHSLLTSALDVGDIGYIK
jgi:hypothetical protein